PADHRQHDDRVVQRRGDRGHRRCLRPDLPAPPYPPGAAGCSGALIVSLCTTQKRRGSPPPFFSFPLRYLMNTPFVLHDLAATLRRFSFLAILTVLPLAAGAQAQPLLQGPAAAITADDVRAAAQAVPE